MQIHTHQKYLYTAKDRTLNNMHTDKHTITIYKTYIQQKKELYYTACLQDTHNNYIQELQTAWTHTHCKITICSTHTHTHTAAP